MRGKRVFLFFVFFINFFLSSLSAEFAFTQQKVTLLQKADVQKVMSQLFEYHVDKKELSNDILERSLKIYISNFDPNHAYLMADEVNQYLSPSNHTLRVMYDEYFHNKFSGYFSLNQIIQQGILRARSWRNEWKKDPVSLMKQLEKTPPEPGFLDHFATNVQELQQKHYQQFLGLISFYLTQLPEPLEPGQEARLVNLCEKQLTMIENQYLGLDESGNSLDKKMQEHLVVLRTIKALAHSLDAHTAYYSPEEAYAMRVQLEKGMCGIGVVLREGLNGVMISDILKGGPADKSGLLHVGDTIVEVDGVSVSQHSFHKILDVLRGEEGSIMVLGVLRSVSSQQKQFVRVEIPREKIVIDDKRVDVSYEPYEDGIIGKITLHSFYEGEDGISSEKDIRKAIDQLKAQGPLYGLVLDMRDNTGGFLSQAIRVSGLFITSGVVVISKYSDGTIKYYRSVEGSKFYDGPLVVLTSKGSASATEIVAQALQDYGVALVVGDERTYGKGTIQHQTVTNDRTNSFFKVTIGRYYTVSGKSTQIDGVRADIVVPTSLHFEKMGECYLDYPLAKDQMPAAFEDPLSDIDTYARKWFVKYYLPTVQPRVSDWRGMLPALKERSQSRLAENKNYQIFLSGDHHTDPTFVMDFSANDVPLEESVNIVRDMIELSQHQIQMVVTDH